MISTRRRRKLCQGGILQAQDLGAEADRGDLARSEPAGRVDSVLLDQILAYGVGLLLGQDLGKVDVVVIVGEGGDDDLRLWLAGLLAPAPDLVEVGAADGGQDGEAQFEQFLIPEQAAVSPRARLVQDLLAFEEGARVRIAGQRPGSLERGEVVFHGRESALASVGQGHQALVSGLITDELAERTLALADRAGNGVDLFEPRLGGPGQVVELLERGTGPLHQVAELDRRLRFNRTSLGDQGRVRPAGRDLDDARADHPFGKNAGNCVRADEMAQPLIQPHDELDRLARFSRGHNLFDHSGIHPLQPHAVPSFQAADG